MDEGKAEMKALDARRKELEVQLKAADEPPPLLHPSIADLYRTKVEELTSALQREDTRLEASEMLRGLIEAIVLTPEKGQLRIELRGNLAAMLAAAQQTKRSPETGDLFVPIQLVAGAGFEISLARFPKLVMAHDFWSKRLTQHQLRQLVKCSHVLASKRESTVVLETFWRRNHVAPAPRRSPPRQQQPLTSLLRSPN